MANHNNRPASPEKYIREKARKLEIGKCYMSSHWQEQGMAMVYVTRKHNHGTFTVGGYLLDTYCLGLKDTLYAFNVDADEYQSFIDQAPDLEEVDYIEAHNLIYAAIEFAEEAGLKPHKDWNVTRYILEEDDDRVPLIEYEMGRDGEHFLVVRDQFELSKYLPTLKKHLGDDVKYVVMSPDSDEYEYDDEEYDDEDEY